MLTTVKSQKFEDLETSMLSFVLVDIIKYLLSRPPTRILRDYASDTTDANAGECPVTIAFGGEGGGSHHFSDS